MDIGGAVLLNHDFERTGGTGEAGGRVRRTANISTYRVLMRKQFGVVTG